MVRSPSSAIHQNSGYGPTFGRGHDIYIANNASNNTNSHTHFAYSYSFPSGVKNSGKKILAGTIHFTPDEVEVFYPYVLLFTFSTHL